MLEFMTQKNKMTSARVMSLWLGSFIVVASFLYYHFGVPLLPIVLAGGFTLVVTVIRYFFSRRARSSEADRH
jgi:membrane protein implicated in regulation of membrane protease activity